MNLRPPGQTGFHPTVTPHLGTPVHGDTHHMPDGRYLPKAHFCRASWDMLELQNSPQQLTISREEKKARPSSHHQARRCLNGIRDDPSAPALVPTCRLAPHVLELPVQDLTPLERSDPRPAGASGLMAPNPGQPGASIMGTWTLSPYDGLCPNSRLHALWRKPLPAHTASLVEHVPPFVV